jgi:hypothetical protein
MYVVIVLVLTGTPYLSQSATGNQCGAISVMRTTDSTKRGADQPVHRTDRFIGTQSYGVICHWGSMLVDTDRS